MMEITQTPISHSHTSSSSAQHTTTQQTPPPTPHIIQLSLTRLQEIIHKQSLSVCTRSLIPFRWCASLKKYNIDMHVYHGCIAAKANHFKQCLQIWYQYTETTKRSEVTGYFIQWTWYSSTCIYKFSCSDTNFHWEFLRIMMLMSVLNKSIKRSILFMAWQILMCTPPPPLSLSHTHTHTHTRCFLWFTGTLHRRNGFYTVQTVCAIALHLPYT